MSGLPVNPDGSRARSGERFGYFAEAYMSSQAHAKGAELARLLEIAQPQTDWLIMDVATGGGHTALCFAPFAERVLATDISPRMLGVAEAFITSSGATNVDFSLADAEALPFPDGAFNLVTCRFAPHHFGECGRFVRQAARVLRSAGCLLVQDQVAPGDKSVARFEDDFESLRDPSHHRTCSES